MFQRLLPFADGSAGSGTFSCPHCGATHHVTYTRLPAGDQGQAICAKCRRVMKEWNDAFSRSFKLNPGMERRLARSAFRQRRLHMVRIIIIFLLMMGMVVTASAIETKATGGFILSAHGAQFEGNECPPTEREKYCYHTTVVQMKIDGPMTNNYTATCQVFDREGKLLGQQTAVTTRSKDAMMNTIEETHETINGPPIWVSNFEIDVSFQQVAKVECEARRVP
jgi:hypothetical protein